MQIVSILYVNMTHTEITHEYKKEKYRMDHNKLSHIIILYKKGTSISKCSSSSQEIGTSHSVNEQC
jgi:hypothetical protein